jgi:hypothetical protein
MAARRKEIANGMACVILPNVLLALICEYDNNAWDILQRVCQDIRILRRIPTLLDTSARIIWVARPMVPRPSYSMTSVGLRVNYINLMPSRTCMYCKSFPSFRVFIRNSMVGLSWPGHGCNWCHTDLGGITMNFEPIGYDDDYYEQYNSRDEY